MVTKFPDWVGIKITRIKDWTSNKSAVLEKKVERFYDRYNKK